jgi:Ca2+-binding RTX toxin-like protein
MRARLSVVLLLLVSVLTVGGGGALAQDGPSSGPSVSVDGAPFCNGKEATKWLDAPGTLNGTAGDDVLVGSPGNDVIHGLGGDDYICGSTNVACGIGPTFGGADKLYGETGNDHIIDTCVASGGTNLGDGGSGNDFIKVKGNALGGSSSDTHVESINGIADGGSGDDNVSGTNATKLLGGSGSDTVINLGGNPLIDCGSAVDSVNANGATVVRRCEIDLVG